MAVKELKPNTIENVVVQIDLMRDYLHEPRVGESQWTTGARDTLDALADWLANG